MHDTNDIRKSKELHDKEMNLDHWHVIKCVKPQPSDLTEWKFRSELIQLLKRIAIALEMPIQVRKEF